MSAYTLEVRGELRQIASLHLRGPVTTRRPDNRIVGDEHAVEVDLVADGGTHSSGLIPPSRLDTNAAAFAIDHAQEELAHRIGNIVGKCEYDREFGRASVGRVKLASAEFPPTT